MSFNISAEVLRLQELRYEFGMQQVDGHTSQIEHWTEQQKTINALYAKLLDAKQSGKTTIDFSGPEHHSYVDDVSEILPELFPKGVYSWHKDHIHHLTDGLNGHVKTIESSMSIRMSYMNHDMTELTKLIEAFHDMNKLEREEITHYVRNQRTN